MRTVGCFFGFMGGGVVGAVVSCALTFAALRLNGASANDGPIAVYGGIAGLLIGGAIAAVWAIKLFK